jgi:hypothetical protein
MANFRARMERIRPPRWVLVRFPRGAMFGEPGRPDRHRAVLEAVLGAGRAIAEPGGHAELPYRWEAPPVPWRGREVVEGP